MIWVYIALTVAVIPIVAGLYWLFNTFGWLAALGLYFGLKPKKVKPVEKDPERTLRRIRKTTVFLAITSVFLLGYIVGVEIGS